MDKPFKPFSSALTWRQASLLLDAALFFEDAPKLLSVPDDKQERVPLPLLPDTIRAMLQALDEGQPDAARTFSFDFTWTNPDEQEGELIVGLPAGGVIRQPAKLDRFSAV